MTTNILSTIQSVQNSMMSNSSVDTLVLAIYPKKIAERRSRTQKLHYERSRATILQRQRN
jgi:hypothetical protein